MTITEEQYESITEELDSHDFFRLGDLAGTASCSNMHQELDNLHGLSKQALDYRFCDNTQESVERFLDEIGEIRSGVLNAIEALEKIDDVLTKAEEVLTETLYVEEFEED